MNVPAKLCVAVNSSLVDVNQILSYEDLMRQVLQLPLSAGEVPVTAAIFDARGTLVSYASNLVLARKDSLAHAEVFVIREAESMLGTHRLQDTTLVTTLQPCCMCAGALRLARIGRVVYGARKNDLRESDLVDQILRDNVAPRSSIETISGVLEQECRSRIEQFFRDVRRGEATRVSDW